MNYFLLQRQSFTVSAAFGKIEDFKKQAALWFGLFGFKSQSISTKEYWA